jgi:hypothetical protein
MAAIADQNVYFDVRNWNELPIYCSINESRPPVPVDLDVLIKMNLPSQQSASRILAEQVLSKKAEATSLAENFQSLVKKWKEETFFISSTSKLYSHEAYVGIIAMGKHGLPFVLNELKNNGGRWFYALRFMAGDEGKEVPSTKDYETAKASWLEWGYKHNYI